MKTLWARLGQLWCTVAHDAVMWPMHGYYRCGVCLRLHPVPWENEISHRAAPMAIPRGGAAWAGMQQASHSW